LINILGFPGIYGLAKASSARYIRVLGLAMAGLKRLNISNYIFLCRRIADVREVVATKGSV